ncbi:MAG TPA: hypothetical protein VFK16_08465 [Gemmatimonadaceae bacterium]|jgi:hypothetical protein|nr:hypothetical protein [Gemmatimonadaceae bacterium]
MSMRLPAAVVTALFLSAGAARAQTRCTATGIPSTCTTSRTLSMTIRPVVRASVSPAAVNLGTPTASDYNQGYMQAAGSQTVTVKSNTTWTLTIRSSQGSWTNVGGRGNKPRGDLEYATSPGGPYTAMPGNGGATALTVATGTATAGTTVTIYYRVLWDWTLDSAGSYSLPVILNISAP